MWVDLLDLQMTDAAERSAQGRWAHGRYEPACLDYDSSAWRAVIVTRGRGARKDARVVRRLLRRNRQRERAWVVSGQHGVWLKHIGATLGRRP